MKYNYTAIDKESGMKVKNVAHAENTKALGAFLKEQGMTLVNATAQDNIINQSLLKMGIQWQKIGDKDIMIFTRQLAATLKAGLLLTESLDTVAENLDNDYLMQVIGKMRKDIEGGSDFSSALGKFPKVFDRTYISIIRSGEATGTLALTLERLAAYLENIQKLKDKIVTATRYPLFVLGFALTVVFVMMVFLVPQFVSMFAGAKQELPLLTRIVIAISNVMIHFWWLIIGLAIGAIAGFNYAKGVPKYKEILDIWVLKIPVIGKDILHKALLSRFCRTFGFLLAGGVSLAKALEITEQVMDHIPFEKAVNMVKRRVVGGSIISVELRKHRYFSNFVPKMVSVGERTGRIDQMLHQTADYYDHEIDHTLSRLTTILEPALIVFVGVIVLFVVLALYLPIFNMAKALH